MINHFIKNDRVTGSTPTGRSVTGIVKIVDGPTLWIDEEGGDPLAWAPIGRDEAVLAGVKS